MKKCKHGWIIKDCVICYEPLLFEEEQTEKVDYSILLDKIYAVQNSLDAYVSQSIISEDLVDEVTSAKNALVELYQHITLEERIDG